MRTSVSLLAAALLALSSCGDSRTVDFPVDDGKTMDTLTPAEAQAMCASLVSYTDESVKVACLAQGLGARFEMMGSQEACEAAVASCEAELQAQMPTCELAQGLRLENCSATVGEYEMCINDSLAMMDELKSKLSCSASLEELTKFYLEYLETNSAPQLPASCQTLQAKCPGLIGQDDVPQI
jgi:hypothetical protein